MPWTIDPVLLDEALELLAVKPGGFYVDGTLGLAGHAAEILRRSAPDGRLLGIDRDAESLARAARRSRRSASACELAHADFREIPALLGAERADGILLDLGMSSVAARHAERGFSFQHDGPLDMRLDRSEGMTAAELVNRMRERELADLIYRYGEERASRRIARAIVAARRRAPHHHASWRRSCGAPRAGAAPARPRPRHAHLPGPAHPREPRARGAGGGARATSRALLAPRGRMAVIAFHSLEDREVKQAFRDLAAARASASSRGSRCGPARRVRREPALAQRAAARARAGGGGVRRRALPSCSASPSTTRRSCARWTRAPAASSGCWCCWWLPGAGGLGLYAWPTSRSAERAGGQQLSRERERLVEENRKLRLEKATLEDLRRVEAIAAASWAWLLPPPESMVVVEQPRPAPRARSARAGARPERRRTDALERPAPPPSADATPPAARERLVRLRLMLLALSHVALGAGHLHAGSCSSRCWAAPPTSARRRARASARSSSTRGAAPSSTATGHPLAVSVDAESIYAVPQEIADPRRTAADLARALGLDAAGRRELQAQLQKNRAFVWVKRKVDPATARAVRDLQLDGIGFLTENRRYYPKRELAAQVLGYVGVDNIGMSGIEYAFDERSAAARPRWCQTDARRRPVGHAEKPTTEGHTMVLTLDEAIQHVAERELERAMAETGPSAAWWW